MINELYQLTEAMDKAGVQARRWHIHYKPIPNITAKAPCVCITISEGRCIELSAISRESGACLRKYGKGTNTGSYPCMNLAPLYRITDDAIKKSLLALKAEDLDTDRIAEIKKWCQNNNWGKKFQSLYKKSMVNQPAELLALAPVYEPLQILVEESSYFSDPMILHQELENAVFRMLERKENFTLAIQLLFYQGKEDETDKYGSISVALESSRLIDLGVPAVSTTFVSELNEALLTAPTSKTGEQLVDAFGILFEQEKKPDPMPVVKLIPGFQASLRTMFNAYPCQKRYGKIDDKSYPVSPQMRQKLRDALEQISNEDNEDITWTKIRDGEILFAYPAQRREQNISFTKMFQKSGDESISFSEQAKPFITELKQSREIGIDSKADYIQLFILKRMGASATQTSTKVVYTRQTDAYELEKCSEVWTLGCSNLPAFRFGTPKAPFPLEAADILNAFWKQNGERATDQCRPVSQHHGLELLMDLNLPVTTELHMLSEKAMTVGAFLGSLLVNKDFRHSIWERIVKMLALMGLMLYRKGIRKEDYMEDFPYQYGQLLKVSDELHAMYCRIVRNGELPPQLAGSSLYQAAAETPLRTMNVLAQRMNPYIAWAKTYRTNTDSPKGTGAGLVKWFLRMYEEIASKLYKAWTPNVRFNDEERAQLFIGYLAALPKQEEINGKNAEGLNPIEEVQRL